MSTLELRGVTKRFGGLVAVDDVSLTAESGAITALIGPNGAGKTTLFNVITGFERPSSGSIVFGGRPITGTKPWQAARVGMVRTFQTPVGFPSMTVWENMMVGGTTAAGEGLAAAVAGPRWWRGALRRSDQRAGDLLRRLGLEHLRETPLADLSAGDTKLVEFARQLMVGPKMLLLDEPASGVDPRRLGQLSDLIRGLRDSGITILVIDHNLAFVMSVASHVHVLDRGRLIASGDPDTVSADPRVVETYLGKAA